MSWVKLHWRDFIAVLTILLVAGSLFLIAYGVRRSNELSDQQRNQISCIAKFYTQSNRQNKVISNIDQCSITNK